MASHRSPRPPRLLGFNAEPGRLNFALAALPFIIVAAAYLVGSDIRLSENPSDKLMPPPSAMWTAFWEALAVPNKRTGELVLIGDWLASVGRLLGGLALAALVGLAIGLHSGLFPAFRRLSLPFVTFVSIIPPLAILPILFITFGTGETGKLALIFFGTVWIITRDIHVGVAALPHEQLIKGLTLGASQAGVTYRIILPQVWPRLIAAVRLNLGPAWLFLIAAEAIASQDGLGYRIFLVRRYLAMDLIIPYVAVITLTGFLLDYALATASRRLFPWYHGGKE